MKIKTKKVRKLRQTLSIVAKPFTSGFLWSQFNNFQNYDVKYSQIKQSFGKRN